MSAAQPRVPWVDTAKALALLTVMVGHVNATPAPLKNYLYTFHVPWFFFLSGLLLKPSQDLHAALQAIGKDGRRLLVPYLVFALVSLPVWALAARARGDDMTLELLIQALWGVLRAQVTGLSINLPLWFLPCLFLTRALLRLLGTALRPLPSRERNAALFLALTACALWIMAQPIRLPWSLDSVPVAAVFLFAGQWVGLQRPTRWLQGTGGALIALVGVAVGLAVATRTGRIDMASHTYPDAPMVLAGGLAGCLAWTAIALRLCALTNRLQSLGKASLTIYGLHVPVYTLISGVLILGPGLTHDQLAAHPLFIFVYVAVACPALLLTHHVLLRRAPTLLGRQLRD